MSEPIASGHPNLKLLERLSKHFPHDMDNAGDLIAEDFVLHYYNSQIPELEGDYEGPEGLKDFFQKLGAMTQGTFTVTDKRLIHVGDELVVTHAKPNMTADGTSFEVDALFIWRVVGGRFVEAWDIPAVNSRRELV